MYKLRKTFTSVKNNENVVLHIFQGSYAILNINFQNFFKPFPDFFRTFCRLKHFRISCSCQIQAL